MKIKDDDLLNKIEEEEIKHSLIKKVEVPLAEEIKPLKKTNGYVNIDLNELPAGNFYPKNTIIRIRPPKTIEIQEYSMMDDENTQDILDKIDDLLNACITIDIGANRYNHLFLKEADRIYVMMYLKELGLPGIAPPTVMTKCECGKDLEIEFIRLNVVKKELPSDLIKYFDKNNGVFVLETIDNKEHVLGIPNIGIKRFCKEKYKQYIKENKETNKSFWETIPYLFPNQIEISDKDLEIMIEEWEKLEIEDYLFINDVISEINLGIDKLQKNCSCGRLGNAPARFRRGFKSFFSFSSGFRSILKQ